MYFIYGDEKFLIKKEIEKITNNKEVSIESFYGDSTFEEITNAITNFSLFNNKKILIFNDLFLFKKNEKNKLEIIKEILNNKNEDYTLIFTLNISNKENLKNDFFDYLLKTTKVTQVKKIEDSKIPNFISDRVKVKGGKISNTDSIYLSSKLPNDLTLIENEVEKLIINNPDINREQIDNLIFQYQSKNSFDFINAINSKNTFEIFKSYNEKINYGEQINSLISSLASSLILTSIYHTMKKEKMSNLAISEKLKIHKFRIDNSEKLLRKINIRRINELIIKLAILDEEIKKGEIEDQLGFEKILLDFIK